MIHDLAGKKGVFREENNGRGLYALKKARGCKMEMAMYK